MVQPRDVRCPVFLVARSIELTGGMDRYSVTASDVGHIFDATDFPAALNFDLFAEVHGWPWEGGRIVELELFLEFPDASRAQLREVTAILAAPAAEGLDALAGLYLKNNTIPDILERGRYDIRLYADGAEVASHEFVVRIAAESD